MACTREIENEKREECGGEAELQRNWQSGRRDETFNQACNQQKRNGAEEEFDAAGAGANERFLARECAGKKKGAGDAETGATSDEDCGEFEDTVGSDEAPKLEAHVCLPAGEANDTDEEAVEKDHV